MFGYGYLGNELVFLIFPLFIEVFLVFFTSLLFIKFYSVMEICMFANTVFMYMANTLSSHLIYMKYIWYCCLLLSLISMCFINVIQALPIA